MELIMNNENTEYETCPDCGGSGADASRTEKCPECKGKGKVKK